MVNKWAASNQQGVWAGMGHQPQQQQQQQQQGYWGYDQSKLSFS